MQELVSRLEQARDKDMREVVAAIMEQLLPILSLGVARWVSRFSRTFISLLSARLYLYSRARHHL